MSHSWPENSNRDWKIGTHGDGMCECMVNGLEKSFIGTDSKLSIFM